MLVAPDHAAPTPSAPTDRPWRRWAILTLLILGACAGIAADLYASKGPLVSAEAPPAPVKHPTTATTAPAASAAGRGPQAGRLSGDRVIFLLRRWLPFALAAALAAIPAVRGGASRFLDRLRTPSPRARRVTTLAIALAATLYLFSAASWQHRDLVAKEQDESMYLVQTQMLARGRLFMPQHPCADFFESFHVMVKPVYAGIYFPGTALAYVPGVWLGLPPWVLSLLIAGAAVGMTYRVAGELTDGLAGLLAALLMVAALEFRHLSTMVMSHTLMILLALLMTWAFLRWRRQRRLGFAALCGLFAGWAAITRPVDAIAYALPLLLAMLWGLRGAPWRRWALTALVGIAAAAPFLALQLRLDYDVTGHLLRTPVTVYHETYWPQVAIGFDGKASAARPPTAQPQFQQYYDEYVLPAYDKFNSTTPLRLLATVRLPMLFGVALPSLLLGALIPLALFELRRPQHWAFVAAFPLFLAGYATFVFFRPQYATVVLPPVLVAVMLGLRAVERAFPTWRTAWATFTTLAIVGLAVLHLPELSGRARGIDQLNRTPILHAFEIEAAKLPHKPALVLVRHTLGQPRHEPTYNNDVAWPDDATIVRAHDLGDRNVELFRYYAHVQPNRFVYLFDKGTLKMNPLGPVTELAKGK